MRAEIIAIGNEILLGHLVNTNVVYLSQKLAELGIEVYRHSTIGDNAANLAKEIEASLSRSDIVFTMGGLGPTVDDITLYAVGSATSRALIYEKKIDKYIASYFKKKGIKRIPPDVSKQAHIPRESIWFKNKVGTAPAIFLKHGKSMLISLPGPPREMIPLLENDIFPYLKKEKLIKKHVIKTKTIKTTGLVEADVNDELKDLLSIGPKTTMGIYAHLGPEVHLKITSRGKTEKIADREIKKVENKIRKRLGNYVYGVNDETLEFVVGKTLKKNKETLSIAESCTGGLVADKITNISGSSDYFKMGVTAYSNNVKTYILGVPKEKIKKYGAVSKEVALDMATGIKKLANTSFGLGITGIAGPTGGTKKKPVGLVYIAFMSNSKKMVRKFLFTGNREEVKLQASIQALDLLRAGLEK